MDQAKLQVNYSKWERYRSKKQFKRRKNTNICIRTARNMIDIVKKEMEKTEKVTHFFYMAMNIPVKLQLLT